MSVCAPCATAAGMPAAHIDYIRNLHLDCEGRCSCLHESFQANTPEILYHGGRGGLKPGDVLLPPVETGFLRPQEMIDQIGLRDAYEDLLLWKPSYRSDLVYATTSLRLALDHAAGWGNFITACGATEVFGEFGSLYEVEADGPLYPDLGLGDAHCCGLPHEDVANWCSFRSNRFIVKSLVHRHVYPAKHLRDSWRHNVLLSKITAPVSTTRMIRELKDAYALWKEQHNGIDFWQ
jgi:hypothetical protein